MQNADFIVIATTLMLPDDLTLAELLPVWSSLVDDLEHLDQLPDHVAQTIRNDADEVADELLARIRLTRICEALCQGSDGSMLVLPSDQMPGDRLDQPRRYPYRWKRFL